MSENPATRRGSGGPLRARLGAVLDASGPDDPLVTALRGATDRLPVPPVTDRATWAGVHPPTRAGLLREAAHALDHPAPVLRASDWARSFRDGVRTAWEDPARQLRTRVATLVLAAVLTGEHAAADDPPGAAPHLDAAADGLLALAEASTWCWAPHDRFTAGRGEVLPDPDEPFLDLGAAEVAGLLAWADHVLGPRWDARVPGLRRRLRREVTSRVLEPFARIRDWHWLGRDGDAHNWNPWIHGAVLAAALLLVDDERHRSHLVRLVVSGLDHFVAVLPDDGGIDEGVAYWWEGACRLLEALDLLAAAGGPRLDARDLPVLAEVVRFPHRMHLGGPWYVNAGDAPARPPGERPWHVPHRWGRRLGADAVRAHARAQGRRLALAAPPDQGLGRALDALCDPAWHAALSPADGPQPDPNPGRDQAAPASERGAWLPAEVWLPRVQVLLARESAGTVAGLTLAAKAGHNGERHNHLDVGTYWVALDGRPVVVDVGQPTYTADSFGPDRYGAWPLRSAWHNVPEPGEEQSPGTRHHARRVRAEPAGPAPALHADLAAAYPDGVLDRWDRTARLVRATATEPAHVLVEDAWRQPSRCTVLLRHVLAGEVTLGAGWARVDAGAGSRLRLIWDPTAARAHRERQPLTDPLLRRSWGAELTRLTLRVTDGGAVPSASFRVRMERDR